MSTLENLRAMATPSMAMLNGMLRWIDARLCVDGERAWLPYGSMPAVERLEVTADQPPSSRLTCDVALGYLTAGTIGGDAGRLDTACALLRHAFDAQGPSGEFVFNYGQYEIDQVDLGTVLDVYGYFWAVREKLPADVLDGIRESTGRAIAFLETMDQPNHPGVIRKRAADPAHPNARRSADYFTIDVLNGNALAATAYCRGAEILNRPELIKKAASFQKNLIDRFGAHVDRWWAYVEALATREMYTPETILYQAMTAMYLEPLYRAQPNEALADVLAASMAPLVECTDADGRLEWSHEARKDFVGTQLLMWPAVTAALADVYDATDAGLRRLRYVATELVDGETGLLLNEPDADGRQSPADELRQLWAVSDLALLLHFVERAEHAAAAS